MSTIVHINARQQRAEADKQARSDAINRAIADHEKRLIKAKDTIAELRALLITVAVTSGGLLLTVCCALMAAMKGGAA